jgi:glycerophosphoryl diester phosphodiesterase
MIEVDVAPTMDGRMALFHDWTVDCLTEGKGVGQIPTVEEGLAALPVHPILFNFKSKSRKEAEQLYAILKVSGRDSAKIGDAFYGGRDEGPVDRIRELMPKNWVFATKGHAMDCTKAYVAYDWTGIVPKSCHNGALIIPINYQFLFWGWPNRLTARMESVG